MKNIMFICTSNTCRSAMAHVLLEKRLEEIRVGAYKVSEIPLAKPSCTLGVYACGIYAEDGQAATYNSIAAMDKYDIDLRGYKSTSIQKSNIEDMSLILCMTDAHRDMVKQIYPELKDKVYTMKEYVNYDKTGRDINIEDPWGYDIETYLFCAKQISDCINLLILKIIS